MLIIGERLIQLRKQQNFSQHELADKIGASQIIIGNYERNANTPFIEVLLKLAKFFNVSVNFLIGEGNFPALRNRFLKGLTK